MKKSNRTVRKMRSAWTGFAAACLAAVQRRPQGRGRPALRGPTRSMPPSSIQTSEPPPAPTVVPAWDYDTGRVTLSITNPAPGGGQAIRLVPSK